MDDGISREFHEKYKNFYEHVVVVTLKDGYVAEGGRYDEFFEDKYL